MLTSPPSSSQSSAVPPLSQQGSNSGAPNHGQGPIGTYIQSGHASGSSASLSGPAPAPSQAGTANSGASSSGLVQSTAGIHMQGMFYTLEVADYLQNTVAIKALLNEKNALMKERDDLQVKLKESADPQVVRSNAVFAAIGNLVATILVGIGINLETADQVPPHAHWVLGLGIVISALSTILPIRAAFGKRSS